MEVAFPVVRNLKSLAVALVSKNAPSTIAKPLNDGMLGNCCWRTGSLLTALKANSACRRLVAADRSWRKIKDIGSLAQ